MEFHFSGTEKELDALLARLFNREVIVEAEAPKLAPVVMEIEEAGPRRYAPRANTQDLKTRLYDWLEALKMGRSDIWRKDLHKRFSKKASHPTIDRMVKEWLNEPENRGVYKEERVQGNGPQKLIVYRYVGVFKLPNESRSDLKAILPKGANFNNPITPQEIEEAQERVVS